MSSNYRKNYVAKQVGIGVIGASLAAYFAFYAIQGDRGLMSMVRDQHRLTESQKTLDDIEAQRILLERRVKGMRGQSLDLDLVDEVARKVLNMTRKDEMVISVPKPTNPQDETAHAQK